MPQMNKDGKFVFGESVIRPDGWVRLPHCFGRKGLSVYRKQNDRRLLCVRSSDIAFTMGAKGPLLEKAAQLDGEIPQF